MNWEGTAKRLFESVGDSWLPARLDALLSNPEKRIWVACSGGADSVFLTLWFWAFRAKIEDAVPMGLLHFNHKLRGTNSDGDKTFVEELGAALNLQCVSDSWIRGVEGDAMVSEANARTARMTFFAKALRGEPNALILTGHHGGDVVETMLMRLSRGSGLAGLSAPRALSNGVFGLSFGRPLLNLEREFLASSLESVGAIWREDDSNQSEDFYRNRLRSSVVPQWKSACDRSLAKGVGYARGLIEEDSDALEQWAERIWKDWGCDSGQIQLSMLREIPRGIQRRLLFRLVNSVGGRRLELGVENVESVLKAIEDETELNCSVGEGVSLILRGDQLAIRVFEKPKTWNAFCLPLGACVFLPNGGRIRSRWVKLDKDLLISIQSGAISDERCIFAAISSKQARGLSVRRWREGDAYNVIGRSSEIKLKKLFNDRKLSFVWRRSAPIFETEEGEILWMPGLPLNKGYLLSSDATHALQLTYEE